MDLLISGIIGLFAGLLGGLLGVGGSIVMIPALTEVFGPKQHLYQAAAMIVNFFVVAPAALHHARAGAVMMPVVRRMVPLAIVAVIVGVAASEWSIFRERGGQAYLIMLFGLFILYVASRQAALLLKRGKPGESKSGFDPDRDGLKAGLLAGVPTGFIAGLLGVGGGIVCVPLQARILGIELRNAIANSATTIIALSLIGAAMKNYALVANHAEYQLADSLRLAATLIPTAIVGSLMGSRLTHRLPLHILRTVFLLFLLIASIRMIYTGIHTLP